MENLKVIKCASCGAELEIKSTRSKFVNCQYCGNTTDLSGILVTVEKGDPEKFKPNSFLKLGLIGIFDDIPYKIIGRTCWRNNYQEYDDEDDQYHNEIWRFDEWILLSDEGNYMTIIEDGEGYSISQSIVPVFPNINLFNDIKNFKTGKSERANEFGISTIEYFEGESTYLIQAGDHSDFTQYEKSGITYIAEWRKKEDKIFEIEFFKEFPISKGKLLKAFKDNPELSDLYRTFEKESKASKTNKILFWGFGLANLIIAIIFSFLSQKKEMVLYKNISISKNEWTNLNNTTLTVTKDIDSFPNFTKNADRTDIYIRATFGQNVELSSKLIFQDKNKHNIAEINDFFYEYKTDTKIADKTNCTHNFRLDKSIKYVKLIDQFELPTKYLSKVNYIMVSYEIYNTNKEYITALVYLYAILFLIVGIRLKKKK